MSTQVNVALQVLPRAEGIHPYTLVDCAIKVIEESGLRYRVCPFETVLEGPYNRVMEVVKQAQYAVLAQGGEEVISFIKIQMRKDADVTMEEKIAKYE